MMSLKAKVEAIIYAAEEPVTLEQIALLLKDVVLADLAAAQENAAIAQADSAAEAEAAAFGQSGFLPVLVSSSPDLPTPEAGPLMPAEGGPGAAPSETAPENTADTEALEPIGSPGEALAEPAEYQVEADATAPGEPASEPSISASLSAPEATSRKRQPKKTEQEIAAG